MATVPSKAEEIIAVLRTEILQGQYRAGERLPSERDLAARFSSNRGAIRESIKKLEQLGIVSVMPGGVRVLPVEDATLDVLGHLLELGKLNRPLLIGQMLDVLGSMTSLSARSAVLEASDEQLEKMVSIVNRLINAVEQHEESHHAWMELSETMMSVHQNLVLRLVNNGLRTQFLDSLMDLGFEPEFDFVGLQRELTHLRDAMQTRDIRRVPEAIIQHFRIIKTGLLESIPQANTTAQTTPHTTPQTKRKTTRKTIAGTQTNIPTDLVREGRAGNA